MSVEAWGPDFLCNANGAMDENHGNFWGEKTRKYYLDTLEAAVRDTASMSVVLLGSHGDDRVALVTRALKRVDESLEPIHAIGTVYAQEMDFGALAFLLTDIAENEDIGPMCVVRSISKLARGTDQRPVVVVQYPQLLDRQSRAVLAQMAFSRSILLVILAMHSESLPIEFVPLATMPGSTEISLEPMALDEVHRLLSAEFSAVPTPLATAELWHRCLGNPGLLVALASDAVATGKLSVHGEHLVLRHGVWPQGGRVEALAKAEVSMLCDSERRFLHHLAIEGSIGLSPLTPHELNDVDHLIGSGFVRRTGTNRNAITHSSKFLEEIFRSEGRVVPPSVPTHGEGNFFALISGENAAWQEAPETGAPRFKALSGLFSVLRESLLDGELEKAQQTIARIVTGYLAELPPAMFEAVVMAETILQVIAGHLNLAQPAIESLLAQLDESEENYDRWLVLSLNNLVREAEDPSRRSELPFEERWEPARWWFTELLASRETTAGLASSPTEAQPNGASQREVLGKIVVLRNGFRLGHTSVHRNLDRDATKLEAALRLLSITRTSEDESEELAGLEALVEAGFVVFALPWGNHIIDSLSANGKMAAASLIHRKRKGNLALSNTARDEFMDQNCHILKVLTNREKMVATAAAQGLNNQQIADGAGVSIRTVEGHLYQIYSKLALAGRRELSTLVESLRTDNSVSA